MNAPHRFPAVSSAMPVEPAWKRYANDFRNMSDKEIEDETEMVRREVEEGEDWLEAVASWEAAGKPRDV